MMMNNRPMTPQEAARLRQRMDAARGQLATMPTDIGSGLAQMGNAIGYRMMQGRLNGQPGNTLQSQVPNLAGSQPEPSPVQRIAEVMTRNSMPWQFPAAPQPTQSPAPGFPAAPAPNVGLLGGFFRPKGGGLY